ncbi:MAG: hypothetical protein EHM59_13515 [Betaproteobacteria bacterium]|nr:MAG: hypothetical protein EHM59_13515 [Betaproteobacteria bacterium]
MRTRIPGARPSAYTLALNALPFVYLACGLGIMSAAQGWMLKTTFGLVWLYLVPPFTARLACKVLGDCVGQDLGQETRAYKLWWFLTQLQVPFNRLLVLEELLRLVPGAYPLWLTLWGAQVSRTVYWAPGAMVFDRTLLRIGPGVVIGTRAVLSAHLACKDSEGAFRVTIAPIEIENDVLVGGYAGIGPGCRIDAGAEVPVAAFLRPFTHWQRGAHPRTERLRRRR